MYIIGATIPAAHDALTASDPNRGSNLFVFHFFVDPSAAAVEDFGSAAMLALELIRTGKGTGGGAAAVGNEAWVEACESSAGRLAPRTWLRPVSVSFMLREAEERSSVPDIFFLPLN